MGSLCYQQTRQKVLILAFVRAMRDPFHPSRTAAILALSATQGYFTLRDCATKVLPSLCALTMDPEKGVRDHVRPASLPDALIQSVLVYAFASLQKYPEFQYS